MIEIVENILVVAAHPDDDVLGCGGAIANLAKRGCVVNVAFLADGIGARHESGEIDSVALQQRRKAAHSACTILGTKPPSFSDFPDNQLDQVPRLSLAKSVESLVEQYRPQAILTHHSGDVNVDHQETHHAVVTACRPQPGHPVSAVFFFEVASSTEWQPPISASPFLPNVFVDISATLKSKIDALKCYEAEMRQWPHPRSVEGATHLARWRGATAGVDAAEAFMLGRMLCR